MRARTLLYKIDYIILISSSNTQPSLLSFPKISDFYLKINNTCPHISRGFSQNSSYLVALPAKVNMMYLWKEVTL